MDRETLIKQMLRKTVNGSPIYIYDSYNDMAIRCRLRDDGATMIQIKHPKCEPLEERKLTAEKYDDDIFNSLYVDGEFISEAEYNNYTDRMNIDYVERALKLAMKAHEGQIDLDGLPEVLHPITVGLIYGKTDDEKIVGLLHDVVEDTGYTFNDLREQGFSEDIIAALVLLTHGKGMTYDEYLKRIKESGNQLAITVKLNDLTHNLKRGRAGGHTKQVEKHTKAMKYMKSKTGQKRNVD